MLLGKLRHIAVYDERLAQPLRDLHKGIQWDTQTGSRLVTLWSSELGNSRRAGSFVVEIAQHGGFKQLLALKEVRRQPSFITRVSLLHQGLRRVSLFRSPDRA
jgi:hypothetical protein